MPLKKNLYIILVWIALAGCQPEPEGFGTGLETAVQSITGESLLQHIEVLSSDEFEGRAPATRGEELTVEYLISELDKAGVQAGGPGEAYTQEFPLLGQVVDGERARFQINTENGDAIGLTYGTDFMAWPANEAEEIEIREAELLYVGYGIQAPEFDWDDYKDTDVEGKVLVFKNGDPSHDPEIFEGDARLYYGRWSYKFEKAEEMGALGAIIIHTDPTAGYGWSVVENSWGRERFSLKSGNEESSSKPEFNSWLTEESSSRLFEAAGLDLHEMLNAAADREFRPVPLDGVSMELDLQAEYSDMSSRNVIGKIEGSDPGLKDQYVIFSAHYDHLGITTPVEGDSVNNGAWDNASGVSAVLEIAGSLKRMEEDLRRSVLFMFVGAEEMGLLGSRYWSGHPTVHPGKVSANINLDGMQIFGKTRDIVVIGHGRNTLTETIENHAAAMSRTVVPDPQPEQGFFYRSDHFSFARVGIPALYPNPGREYIDKPDNWNAIADSVRSANYHSVSDEINEYWDMAGMEADTRLIFRTAVDVINADEMMQWYPGDEFEAIRRQMLKEAEGS